ncbi:MAG: hypothetical protein ACLRLX_02200 [Anaerovoracaceae bacterium]
MRYVLDYTLHELKNLFLTEKNKIEKLSREIKAMPKGELVIKKTSSRFLVYKKNGDIEKSIMSDKEMQRILARKCFIKNQIAQYKVNCEVLKAAIETCEKRSQSNKKYLHKVTYERLQYIFPEEDYKFCKEQILWKNNCGKRNQYKSENLKYRTRSGIFVRSKSERMIADVLNDLGVVFRYEAEFFAEGKHYYPDFTILCSDGNFILWEHFGLMNDKNYALNSYLKIEKYRQAGYKTNKNLICTYEDDIISEEILIDIIGRYMKDIILT